MSVIALNQLWIEANFKESQLKNLRIGQPAELVADVYGKKVEYHGKVEGLGAGTGSAFSLLPAQNATGNWIKVVQRVPVRITLDPQELEKYPLRVGLSMDAKVDISQTDGHMLADGSRPSTITQTNVFDQTNAEADAEVRRIIVANGGPGVKVSAAHSGAHVASAKHAASSTASAASGATVASATPLTSVK
jgi:membrane fusion protein (multidrug efflux system)